MFSKQKESKAHGAEHAHTHQGHADKSHADAKNALNQEGEDLSVLQEKLTETKDELYRALAELENVRKRFLREREKDRAYAIASFARDILSVSDNLERALDAVGAERRGPLVEGVELTLKELLGVFKQHDISKINPQEGEKFDPNIHEAMLEVEHDTYPSGCVIHVLSCGYFLKDKLLRPARVSVSKNLSVEKNTHNTSSKEGGE